MRGEGEGRTVRKLLAFIFARVEPVGAYFSVSIKCCVCLRLQAEQNGRTEWYGFGQSRRNVYRERGIGDYTLASKILPPQNNIYSFETFRVRESTLKIF